jgi:hypothetical protein
LVPKKGKAANKKNTKLNVIDMFEDEAEEASSSESMSDSDTASVHVKKY